MNAPVVRPARRSAGRSARRQARWDPATLAVLTAALRVAAGAPLRQANYTSSARVPWAAVNALRAAFDELGIDWRDVASGARAKKEDS